MFALLAPILLAAAVAQQAPVDDTNAMCVERIQFPTVPPIAKAARITTTVTAVVILTADARVDMISTTGEKKALFVRAIENSIWLAAFKPDCGGRKITLLFEFRISNQPSGDKQEENLFEKPNRYVIVAHPGPLQVSEAGRQSRKNP